MKVNRGEGRGKERRVQVIHLFGMRVVVNKGFN